MAHFFLFFFLPCLFLPLSTENERLSTSIGAQAQKGGRSQKKAKSFGHSHFITRFHDRFLVIIPFVCRDCGQW